MAKVTITIEDQDDGTFTMKMKSNPAFPNPRNPKMKRAKLTGAQTVAAALFQGLTETMLGEPAEDRSDARLPDSASD